jgi:hypothetical protein
MDRSLWITPDGFDITLVVRRLGNGTLPSALLALAGRSVSLESLMEAAPAIAGPYVEIQPPRGFVEARSQDPQWRIALLAHYDWDGPATKQQAIDALLLWAERHLSTPIAEAA